MRRGLVGMITAAAILAVASAVVLGSLRLDFPGRVSAAAGCADVDGDGGVHMNDVMLVANYYGSLVPPGPKQADIVKSGMVTVADILAAVAAYGTTTACQTNPLAVNAKSGGGLAVDADGETAGGPVQTVRTVAVGATFHVGVQLTSNPGIAGYDLRLHWDEAYLDLVPRTAATNNLLAGVTTYGQALGPADDKTGNDAYISLAASFPSPTTTSTTGSIAQFEFTCQAAGTAGLTLSGPGTETMLFTWPTTKFTPAVASAQVRCAVPVETVSQAVDPVTGGFVGTGVGDPVEVQLTIPPGSIGGAGQGQGAGPSVVITIDVFNAVDAPVPLDQAHLPGVPNPANLPDFLNRVYDIGPDGATFDPQNPAQLLVTYDQSVITGSFEQALGMVRLDEGEGPAKWRSVDVPSRSVAGNTFTAEVLALSIWGPYQPVTDDTDSDGCIDVDEFGTDPRQGGRRSAVDFWDFWDTPNASGGRDRGIAVTDIFAVAGRFGSSDTGAGDFYRDSDPLSAPNPVVAPANARSNYHPALDRGGPEGADVWNQAPADGGVAVADVFAVAAQFGHNCN